MKNLILVLTTASLAVAATGCGRYCKRAREEILVPTQTVETYLQTNPSGQDLVSNGCGLVLGQLAGLPDGASVIRHLAETRFTHTNSYCLNWQTATRMHCDYYKSGPLEIVSADEDKDHGGFGPGHGGGGYHPGNPGGYHPGNPGGYHPGNPGGYHPGNPGGYHPYPGPVYHPHPHCYPETYTFCGQWQYDTIHEPGYAAAVQLSTDIDKMYAQGQQMCNDATSGNLDQAQAEAQQLLQYIQSQVQPEGTSVYAQACH